MKPDYEAAALKATETLIKYGVSFAPVLALPILKRIPGVLVLSFAEMANDIGVDRKHILQAFGDNQDSIALVEQVDGKLKYIVGYNQRLPLYMGERALARELGHIILKHDGSKQEDVRLEEAETFCRYLLFPRPLIHAIQQTEIPFTTDVLGNMTGCYDRCQRLLRKTPGIRIPAEMNRRIRAQFADYIDNYMEYLSILAATDESPLADLGTFMDNYEE